MLAVWTLARAYLRKKKLQNGLIALLILLSTLLLATSSAVISNTSNIFKDRHNSANGSHQLLLLGAGLHDPQFVHDWWKKQEGVTASELMPYRSLSGINYQGKEIANMYLYMMDTQAIPPLVDNLEVAQGAKSQQPKQGTVWVPTSLASSQGLLAGDTIEFNTGNHRFELTISAVVIDIPFGGPFATSARIWMNNEDYKEQLQAMQGTDKYMLALRFEDYKEQGGYWERFEQALGSPYLESKMEFEEIASFYLIINQVIGFIMVFLGIVMMLVALYTIGFTISDAILSQYRTIGVLKTIGLTANKIIAAYVLQYACLASIAVIPGLMASSWISRLIVASSLSVLRTENSDISLQGTVEAIVIGAAMFLLVIICVLFHTNKARSVQPVQAIRYGMSEEESSKLTGRLLAGGAGSRGRGFGRFPVAAVLGFRHIQKHRKGSLLMLILATVTTAVLVLGFILMNSIFSIKQTASLWGYDSSDIAVTIVNKAAFSRGKFEQELLADSRIKNIGWIGYANSVIPYADARSLNINTSVVDGSYEKMGYTVLKGHNPRNKNEIAIGVNVSRELGKEIGDVVEVYVQGHKYTLTVSGIYQAIANMSYSARMTADTIRMHNADYNDMEISLINLHDSKQSDAFVKALNAKQGESISAVTQQTLLDAVYKEAVSVLIVPMSLMGLLFLFVTFIIIYTTCRISIRKEGKTYGIYKSIGMTANNIRISVTIGIVAVAALGTALGVFIGVYVLPLILGNVLVDYGLVELPLILSWGGIVAMAVTSLIAAALGSWLSSRVIRRTSPRILVVE